MDIRIIILFLLAGVISCTSKKQFSYIESEFSGIEFNNEIIENDTQNILVNEYVYNGGGVALGDVNEDGLLDVFFSGNQVDNRLYINQKDLKFQDITEIAGISKTNPQYWSSGVNIIDVNQDGLNDIYICNTLHKTPGLRKNELWINQGIVNGIPKFEEQGKIYGLDIDSHSSHAQFFDYDRDGDLDLFIGVNVNEKNYPNAIVPKNNDGTDPNRDQLFECKDSLGQIYYQEVSLSARIMHEGYSHSTSIGDFNRDGWPDIYVANDYNSNDLLFLNQHDGTFWEVAGDVFKHGSLSAMGSDIGDINNDGYFDLFTSEMQPYYNKRKKLFQGPSNYTTTINRLRYGYNFQYARNTLQLNQGLNTLDGLPIFSEVGLYAGVMETDWSWATLFADFDLDGNTDLYISNGFPKDVTDRDFSDFRAVANQLVSHDELYAAIPEVKLPNFMFRNTENISFENVTSIWDLDIPSFSYGAAYGDLDLDGDLDLVVNNLDDPAFVIENHQNELGENNWLRIQLIGPAGNSSCIGATVELRYGDANRQIKNIMSGRGYLSQPEFTLHFGLGDHEMIDTIIIHWPNGKLSYEYAVSVNQQIELLQPDRSSEFQPLKVLRSSFLHQNQDTSWLNHKDRDDDFIDFNIQRTLPHKFSQYGPSISAGDVNNDRFIDFIFSGSRGQPEKLFLGQKDGFELKNITLKLDSLRWEEDVATLLFDADQDGDLDLYIVRGSAQYPPDYHLYQDILAINNGSGDFIIATNALPAMTSNGSCVKAADYDNDGDLDLFIGGSVLPNAYPYPDRSYVLRNESTPDNIKFVDATREINEELLRPGLVSDALWTDINHDNWLDLIIVGEWMAVQVFINLNGKLVNQTEASGLANYLGWWTSINGSDLDSDGDVDYIVGNYGENLYFQCNEDQPIVIYGKDLDGNGSIDPLIACHWQDSSGNIDQYLYHPWQDLVKQFTGIRKHFNSFGEFGEANLEDILAIEDMSTALVLTANWMKSSLLENMGNGKFQVHPLPIQAQIAPIFGSTTMDLNQDGMSDILLTGNDYGMEVQQGRADALNGLVLLNQGEMRFSSCSFEKSGFIVPDQGRALISIPIQGELRILATQNGERTLIFNSAVDNGISYLTAQQDEAYALITDNSGKIRKVEFYWGGGYKSQSSRFATITPLDQNIQWYNHLGEQTRKEEL